MGSEKQLYHVQSAGEKTLLLKDHLPDLNLISAVRHLSEFSQEDLIKLKAGAFGSLAFDVVFSPGIIPKKREPEYRQAYCHFFREQYGMELFDQEDLFVFPKEEDFYFQHPQAGPNEESFLREWVANLRAVAMLLRRYRPMENTPATITNNLIEAALCRMAENGEEWPADLIYALPYPMQERLDTLRSEVKRETSAGRNLAPGQFFQMANQLEFREREFMRQSTHQRVDMVITEIQGHQTLLPPEPGTGLRFDLGVDWHNPTPRQFRQVNLSSIMHNLEQAQRWADLLLGLKKNSNPQALPDTTRSV